MFNYISWWQSLTLHMDQEAYSFLSKRKYGPVSVCKLLKQFSAFYVHRGSSCLGSTRFYWAFMNQGHCASRKNSIQLLLHPVLQKSNLTDFLITCAPLHEGLWNRTDHSAFVNLWLMGMLSSNCCSDNLSDLAKATILYQNTRLTSRITS